MAKANVNNEMAEINEIFNQLPPSSQENILGVMRQIVSAYQWTENYIQELVSEGLTEAEARQRLDDKIAASLADIDG